MHRPAIEPRNRQQLPGADVVPTHGRQHGPARYGKGGTNPAGSQTLACADTPYTEIGRACRRLAEERQAAVGKPSGMSWQMNGSRQSDGCIVPVKFPNKAGRRVGGGGNGGKATT